jgi:N-acetylneuraminic acid mutarotase
MNGVGACTLAHMRGVGLAVCAAVAVAGCGGEERREVAAGPKWRTLAPAKLARTEVAAARVGRYTYAMGGFVRAGFTSAATERYDIERDRWTRVANMPVALNHAAAVAYKKHVYVLGGYSARTSLDGEVATLYRYDPERDRWRQLPSMPTARGALAVGVIKGRLYATGGASDGNVHTELEIYNFKRRRWSTGPAMPTGREHLAGAVAGRRFYALAGRAAGHGNYDIVEVYDPRARRWRAAPPMEKPRGGIGAANVGGKIVVAGGEESAGTIREVELFDPRRRRWTRLRDLPTPRHGLGVVSRGRRVYVIEGGDQPGFAFTRTVEVLAIGG